MTTRPQIAETLRALRESRGLSVQELADAVGVHRGTIYRIEAGEFWPALPQLIKILEALRHDMAFVPNELEGKKPTDPDPILKFQYIS